MARATAVRPALRPCRSPPPQSVCRQGLSLNTAASPPRRAVVRLAPGPAHADPLASRTILSYAGQSDILTHGCTSWLGLCPLLARSEHLTQPRSVLVLRDRILPQPRRCSRFHFISPPYRPRCLSPFYEVLTASST